MTTETRGAVNWTRLPGYPALSGKSGEQKIQDKFRVAAADLVTLPAFRSKFVAAGWPSCYALDVYLADIGIKPTTPGVFEVTLNYEVPSYDPTETEDSETISKETQDVDVPLSQHPNYRTKWDYCLAVKLTAGTLTVPSWWSSATDTVLSTDNYRWLKPGDSVPDGFVVIAAETKPGQTTYRRGVTIVHYVKRSRSKTRLERDCSKDYKRTPPPDDFGVSGVWLRGGSSITYNGKCWELAVDYTNSKTIDEDLYDTYTPA